MNKNDFKKIRAHNSNFTNTDRSKSQIKWIIVHYTGNKGDTAYNNGKYFKGANRHASANYFVDGGRYIYKSVYDKDIAWAVGGFFTQKDGAGEFYKIATNANSISIEMCNSVGHVPEKVYAQTVELVKYLMRKYNIKPDHVIRHWDVNGKECPGPWIGESDPDWKRFKKDISPKKKKPAKKKPAKFAVGDYDHKVIITKNCPVRIGRGKKYKKIGDLKPNDRVKVLYIGKAANGNLWGSVEFRNRIGYIYMENCKPN